MTVPKEAPFLFFNLSCSNQNGADDNVYVESCNLFPVPDLTDSPQRLKPAPKAVKKTVKKASGTPRSMPELLKVPSGLKRTGVNLLKNPDFNFLGCRKIAFAVSGLLIIGSLVAFGITKHSAGGSRQRSAG